jgi:type II secretion system protein C
MRYIKRLHKLLWVVNVALAVVLVFVAVVYVASPPSLREATGTTRRDTGSAASDGASRRADGPEDPKLILARDIFGTGQGEREALSAQAEALKAVQARAEAERELPFRLLGTVASDTGASYAVMEDLGTKTQDLYRVGDAIGEARIDTIEQNRVVVVNMGVRQVLDLVLTGSSAKPGKAVRKEAAPPLEKARPENVVRVAANGQREINTRASASNVGQMARSFLSKMKLSPLPASGQAAGLRVSGLGDSTMSALVGLRDGDVIQSINGQSVPNRRKATQVLKKARQLGSARLQLLRGQQQKSLAFHAGSW